jgi:hypothetical protein
VRMTEQNDWIDDLFVANRLKQVATKDLEKAIAEALAKAIGREGESLYEVDIRSFETDSMDVKMSLRIKHYFADEAQATKRETVATS